MVLADFKYIASLSIPLSAAIGMYFMGYWSYFTPFYAFVVIPFLELVLPQDASNLSDGAVLEKGQSKVFDWLLYLNIPLVFGFLSYGLQAVSNTDIQLYETIGAVISTGIILGVNGINVAHELGHRQHSFERHLGKLLLLPSFYMHFYIEHNFGHHANAATKEDPATAKYNQSVYSFWATSVIGQYFNAWELQFKLLKNTGNGFVSLKNDMFWYTVFQLGYVALVVALFGVVGFWFATGAGLVGFLLLETVNYIEHYGLMRKKLPSGRYERVRESHSWNSNHLIGRIVLYELTRHSDHHYKSSKKYQLLDCHDGSPQMPFGYPTSMVLSLVPPLWFAIMNPKIPDRMKPGRKSLFPT